LQDDYVICDGGDDAEIVGDEQDREPELGPEVIEDLEDRSLNRDVER